MLNAHWSQLLEEARQHWQHALTAGAFVKSALPIAEWLRIAVVALVTAVVTSQVSIARLDERIVAIGRERDIIIKKRDEQVVEIKRNVERVEAAIVSLQVQIASLQLQLARERK